MQAIARDVNDSGTVVGWGMRADQLGERWATIWGADNNATLLGFIGDPGQVNDEYQVAGTAKMDDGSVHAVRWRGAAGTDLGCYLGKEAHLCMHTSKMLCPRMTKTEAE
jgi:uncharacterized membrane protein